MNAMMMLWAQVAPAMADSIAGANPVLTPVAGAEEMNLWSMAVKGGWIMVVLGLLSVLCFYILFERNYVIRKAGKEDPMFMDKIKDYILGGRNQVGTGLLPQCEHAFGTYDRERYQPVGTSRERRAGCHRERGKH